jgi:hypothetical protein
MDEGGYHGVHFGGGNFVPGAANLINGINDQGVVAGSLIIGGQLNAGGGIPVDPHVFGAVRRTTQIPIPIGTLLRR